MDSKYSNEAPRPQKPPVNQAARIVNSLFLDSDYQGKDWESVRLHLIAEIETILEQTRTKAEDYFLDLGYKAGINAAIAAKPVLPATFALLNDPLVNMYKKATDEYESNLKALIGGDK